MFLVYLSDDRYGWVMSTKDIVSTFSECGFTCSEFYFYECNKVTLKDKGKFLVTECTRTFNTFEEADAFIKKALHFTVRVKDCPSGTFIKLSGELMLVTNERRLVSIKTPSNKCTGYLTTHNYEEEECEIVENPFK